MVEANYRKAEIILAIASFTLAGMGLATNVLLCMVPALVLAIAANACGDRARRALPEKSSDG